ncbi:RICIN domain-containing protein [Streptomyces thioluteus]
MMLEAGDSDRCLAAGKKNGSRAGMDFCTTDWDTGLWRVIPVDNSSFEFRAVPTDKCLEVENSGTQAGAAVQVWDCTGGKQMRWQMDLVDPARQLYQLRPTHTEGRCLDIVNGNVELGARAQSWSCNQTNAQLWRIRPVERPAS